jgi:hypothetical protein
MYNNIFTETDAQGQSKVVPELITLLSAATLTFEQHIEDNGCIDILLTATTTNNNYLYAAECKDRKYKHTYSNEWFLEKKKYKRLMEAHKKGYKPLYINTFKDDWIIIWDLTKCHLKTKEKVLSKTTVVDSGQIKKDIYLLNIQDAVVNKHLFLS